MGTKRSASFVVGCAALIGIQGFAIAPGAFAADTSSPPAGSTSPGPLNLKGKVDVTAGTVDTGVSLASGTNLTITPQGGTVNWGTPAPCFAGFATNAAGQMVDGTTGTVCTPQVQTTGDPNLVVPNLPNGALLGRIGDTGSWFLVGGGYNATAPAGGELYLRLNSDAVDNTGRDVWDRTKAQGSISYQLTATGEATGVVTPPPPPPSPAPAKTTTASGGVSGSLVHTGLSATAGDPLRVTTGQGESSSLYSPTTECNFQWLSDPSGNFAQGHQDCGAGTAPTVDTHDPHTLAPNLPTAALIGRMGDTGSWFLVGSNYNATAPATGELELALNLNASDAGDQYSIFNRGPSVESNISYSAAVGDASRAAAIAAGPNKVQVCNDGGFAARAVVDYSVQTDPFSTNLTTGHIALSSFPLGQCRTATLPAGKVAATADVYRYTGWYKGNYAFWDGDLSDNGQCDTFAGCDNDRLIDQWSVAGSHADVTLTANGTTCEPGLSISKAGDNTAVDAQVGSTDQGCSGKGALGDLSSAFSGGVPTENTGTAYTVGNTLVQAFNFIADLFGGEE
ncbi:hypothetical protein [Kitasatospora kifunensis]|uniref:Uncharacterized protein n=1 Tax=Kitasatospora kifunensis TaxID=58351 RepID=A0A7W7RA62_KITKI|nr:hypothetical protein [Kitasatospora kifunensis]MBB4928233.1 hypothetical protein [Kitasatospora kifunensis]